MQHALSRHNPSAPRLSVRLAVHLLECVLLLVVFKNHNPDRGVCVCVCVGGAGVSVREQGTAGQLVTAVSSV